MTNAYEWRGRTVIGDDGEKIGSISEIFVDEVSGEPEWATVHTGLFGTKTHFVPLASAAPQGEDVRVPVTKDDVKGAPSIDPEGALSRDEEATLFDYYGMAYADDAEGRAGVSARSGDMIENDATGYDTSGPTTDRAMTRSEEELRVGRRAVEAGRVRLRKYVVTDTVTQTVPVQREEVRLEREPITEANRDAAMAGPAISEEEHEVVLHSEEPVVEKRVVPKERVRLRTERVTDEREVSEQVRREQFEVDDADSALRGSADDEIESE
jgi:uncharacterized protein (TIGR02271 family)